MPVVAATAFHIGNGLKGAESNASECPFANIEGGSKDFMG